MQIVRELYPPQEERGAGTFPVTARRNPWEMLMVAGIAALLGAGSFFILEVPKLILLPAGFVTLLCLLLTSNMPHEYVFGRTMIEARSRLRRHRFSVIDLVDISYTENEQYQQQNVILEFKSKNLTVNSLGLIPPPAELYETLRRTYFPDEEDGEGDTETSAERSSCRTLRPAQGGPRPSVGLCRDWGRGATVLSIGPRRGRRAR